MKLISLAFCKQSEMIEVMSAKTDPQLAPAGAGLPFWKLMIAKRLFKKRAEAGNQAQFLAKFGAEDDRVRELAAAVPLEAREIRILVPKLRGLEDNSRFYSIWMVMDHLSIVNEGVVGIISALNDGVRPSQTLTIEGLKPREVVGAEAGAGVEARFERSARDFVEKMEALGELNGSGTFEHPWFGALTAYEWLALAAVHQMMHRVQIEAICDRL